MVLHFLFVFTVHLQSIFPNQLQERILRLNLECQIRSKLPLEPFAGGRRARDLGTALQPIPIVLTFEELIQILYRSYTDLIQKCLQISNLIQLNRRRLSQAHLRPSSQQV